MQDKQKLLNLREDNANLLFIILYLSLIHI